MAFAPNSLRYDQQRAQAFAGNIIPAADLFCPAVNLLTLLPAPNAGAPGQTFNNYATSGSGIFNTNQWDVRIQQFPAKSWHVLIYLLRFDAFRVRHLVCMGMVMEPEDLPVRPPD